MKIKKLLSPALVLLVVAALGYFLPVVALVFVACGLYDVARNRPLTGAVIHKYFFGNGILTWLLAPFNTLMDILSLPYWNKGIYKLEDLPKPYRAEIQRLMDAAHQEDLVGKLEARTRDVSRSMIFFKWYGANIDNFVDVPAFHEPYRYIQTIGVSIFNKKQSTSKHFGPLRATLRVLYNVNDIKEDTVYIEVGDTKNYWRENKLFIFDDTLQHQSFNESNTPRYCLFVDILRPSLIPFLMTGIVRCIRFLSKGFNYVFYKNWQVIRN